jgi:hypothetical protein
MRTLLRHTQTGFYFQGPGRWTDDPEGAYDFRFIDRAVRYIETWDLREVELAFASSDPLSITMVAFAEAAPRLAA